MANYVVYVRLRMPLSVRDPKFARMPFAAPTTTSPFHLQPYGQHHSSYPTIQPLISDPILLRTPTLHESLVSAFPDTIQVLRLAQLASRNSTSSTPQPPLATLFSELHAFLGLIFQEFVAYSRPTLLCLAGLNCTYIGSISGLANLIEYVLWGPIPPSLPLNAPYIRQNPSGNVSREPKMQDPL